MFSFRYWTIGALSTVFMVCAVNFIVDPMFFFRVPVQGNERYYPEAQRYQVPGIAKNYQFDAVVIGSSLSENFSTKQLNERLGVHAVNLSISASTAKEQANILELALARGQVKEVLWLLNWDAFAYGAEYIPLDVSWPQNVYESPVLATFQHYLANGDMFKKSMKLLFSKKNMARSVDMDTAWNWSKKFNYGCASVMTSVEMRKSNPMYEWAKKGLIQYAYADVSNGVDLNLIRIIQGNPGIRFHLVVAPYSKWAYIKNNEFDEIFLQANLNFREKIRKDVQGISNVSVYDYQSDTQIILNANNYKDVIHFSQDISNQIVDDVASSKIRPMIMNDGLLSVVRRPGNCLN